MKKTLLGCVLLPASLLDQFIKQTTKQFKVAGASVLIAQQCKIVLYKGYGFVHLGFRVPATPHHSGERKVVKYLSTKKIAFQNTKFSSKKVVSKKEIMS